jgi:hypothetical protein
LKKENQKVEVRKELLHIIFQMEKIIIQRRDKEISKKMNCPMTFKMAEVKWKMMVFQVE